MSPVWIFSVCMECTSFLRQEVKLVAESVRAIRARGGLDFPRHGEQLGTVDG